MTDAPLTPHEEGEALAAEYVLGVLPLAERAEAEARVRRDPVFAAPTTDDYRLGPGSAAFDAGTDAGVALDVDGDVRPLGAGFDIGYDEFTPWKLLLAALMR
jgi:hypothetical protein